MEERLTERQKRFIDYYITTGNKTEAARLAGYKQPESQGSQNYEKLRVFINNKLAVKDIERIAAQDEILEYLTKGIRGELTEEAILPDGTVIEKQLSVKDAIRCAELLGKRYGLFAERVRANLSIGPVIIVDDIPRPCGVNDLEI